MCPNLNRNRLRMSKKLKQLKLRLLLNSIINSNVPFAAQYSLELNFFLFDLDSVDVPGNIRKVLSKSENQFTNIINFNSSNEFFP